MEEEQITIYYQQEDDQYEAMLPKGKGISKSEEATYDDDKYYMKLFPSLPIKDNTSSTIIDWGVEGFKKDTIDCIYTENERSLSLTEAMLNEEPFYNIANHNVPLKIIKTEE